MANQRGTALKKFKVKQYVLSLFLSGLGVSWRTVLKEQSDQVARKEYSAKNNKDGSWLGLQGSSCIWGERGYFSGVYCQ